MPNRTLRDALLTVSKFLPAAGADNTTDAIDLGSVQGAADPPLFNIEVAVPALPNNTDAAKTILLELYESDDGVTFTEAVPLVQCKVAGVATTGSEATTFTFRAHPDQKRYVAIKSTVPAGAGDNTAKEVTVSILC